MRRQGWGPLSPSRSCPLCSAEAGGRRREALGERRLPVEPPGTISFSQFTRALEAGWWWFSRSVVSESLQLQEWCSARLLCPWDSPGKNTGVGCHFLLRGIFPTLESNPGLLHCRCTLYQLSHQGSPKAWEMLPFGLIMESLALVESFPFL